jgi:hypothetical protein
MGAFTAVFSLGPGFNPGQAQANKTQKVNLFGFFSLQVGHSSAGLTDGAPATPSFSLGS